MPISTGIRIYGIRVYETPLFCLAREIAEGFNVPFGLTPQPFYSAPMSPDNLVLKHEVWRRVYGGENKHVGNRLVRYIRSPSAKLMAKIKEFAQGRTIQDAVEALLPELYADRPDSEFAFFERKDFVAPAMDRATLIKIDRDKIEIEVRGRDSRLVAPQLESMVKFNRSHHLGIELRPYAAFDFIKSYLLC